jgi:hypothetical protein
MLGRMECSRCGVEVPTDANFCPGCGSRQTAPAPEPKGEQRQLTVMFIDLVGSTAMSERLTAEGLGDVIRSYQAKVTTIRRCPSVKSRRPSPSCSRSTRFSACRYSMTSCWLRFTHPAKSNIKNCSCGAFIDSILGQPNRIRSAENANLGRLQGPGNAKVLDRPSFGTLRGRQAELVADSHPRRPRGDALSDAVSLPASPE